MIERIIIVFALALLIASCGVPAATEAPLATASATTEPPAFQSLEAPTRRPSATVSPTLVPTQILPTRTDTPLPTLDLPTEIVNPPAQMVWDGAPTYPSESTPGFAFRVRYDPELWALTTDQFGFPALGHRVIPNCVISVTSGRGLPPSMIVEHAMLYTGDVTFDVSSVYENGALKFVTYTGGNATIITGFEVSFGEKQDPCLADAVRIVSTLTSVPASQATPTATP